MATTFESGLAILRQGLQDLSGSVVGLRDAKERDQAAQNIEKVIGGDTGKALASDVRRGVATSSQVLMAHENAQPQSVQALYARHLKAYFDPNTDPRQRAIHGIAIKSLESSMLEQEAGKAQIDLNKDIILEGVKQQGAVSLENVKASNKATADQKKEELKANLPNWEPDKRLTQLNQKIATGNATPNDKKEKKMLERLISQTSAQKQQPGQYAVELLRRQESGELSDKEAESLQTILGLFSASQKIDIPTVVNTGQITTPRSQAVGGSTQGKKKKTLDEDLLGNP